jgi:site-specific DNA-methyltransferase (adenine-specific)
MLINVPRQGDALELLCSFPDACTPLVFFDPQHRGVLDHLQFGNEGARQRGRASLPPMTEDYIDRVCLEIVRALKPGGYLMRWVDPFGLCEAQHLRIANAIKAVDEISWNNMGFGMGKRTRENAACCWLSRLTNVNQMLCSTTLRPTSRLRRSSDN